MATSSMLTPNVLKDLLQAPEDVDFVVEHHKELEQSDVSVIRLAAPPHKQLILKHISLPVLRKRVAKTDAKWAISARSFQNETAFYSATDAEDLARYGMIIPHAIAVRRPHKSLTRSPAFLHEGEWWLLMELLPKAHWEQRQVITSAEEAKMALSFLASFHAYFWEEKDRLPPSRQRAIDVADGDEEGRAHVDDLFPFGSWWRRELRPSVNFERTERVYREMASNFPDAFTGQDIEKNAALLRKLSEPATLDYLDSQLRPSSSSEAASSRTLVHGDFKSSNWFFPTADAPQSPSLAAEPKIAVIDFQWTGWSRSGCSDLAYFMYGAISGDMLQRQGDELLAFYYRELSSKLWKRAAGEGEKAEKADEWPTFTRRDFQRAFRLEVLDLVKTSVPQLMAGIDAAVAKENETKYGFLTHEFEPLMMRLMTDHACTFLEEEVMPHLLR